MSTLAYALRASSVSLRFWRWKFWTDRKWLKSSAISIMMWLVGTKILKQYDGWAPGWIEIVAVGLLFDSFGWGLNRTLIWTRRQNSTPVSIGRNTVVWAVFLLVNFGLALLANKGIGLSTIKTREALIPYGILINPVKFHINNGLVFGAIRLKDIPRLISDSLKKTTA